MIRLSPALALTLALATTAGADPTNPSESSRFYAEARGWQIEALFAQGMFVGCRATIPLQAGGPLLVEHGAMAPEDWQMFLPTSQAPSPLFGRNLGGRFIVDTSDEAADYTLHNGGWASTGLSAGQRQQLMDGNILTAWIEGEEPRQWILNGSTAAFDVSQECVDRQGTVWR